jgi:hypothetical protein
VVMRRGPQRVPPARRLRRCQAALRAASAAPCARARARSRGRAAEHHSAQARPRHLGTTSIYLEGIDPEEIIASVRMRGAPMTEQPSVTAETSGAHPMPGSVGRGRDASPLCGCGSGSRPSARSNLVLGLRGSNQRPLACEASPRPWSQEAGFRLPPRSRPLSGCAVRRSDVRGWLG